nr:somatostatin receptor type 5-like [Procambarus clarkii]
MTKLSSPPPVSAMAAVSAVAAVLLMGAVAEAAEDSCTPKPETEVESQYRQPMLTLTAVFVFLIAIVGTIGNFLAVLSLMLSKKLRQSPSTTFMVNLPACLLPVCMIGMPMFGGGCLQVHYHGRVTYPEWLTLVAYTLGLTLSQVHLHTICALALNRLLAVMYPALYKRIMQRRNVTIYMIVLWLYSALLWVPLSFGVFGQLVFEEKELMVSLKKDSNCKASRARRAVHVFFTYVLPILFTSGCYILMYIRLRHSPQGKKMRVRRKSVSEAAEDRTLRQWDEQVTRTILVIFLVLLTCSVPHIVIHVLNLYDTLPTAWLLFHVVFWLQFCLDPIVYMLMSQQYREASGHCLRTILSCFPVFNVSENEPKSEPRSELKSDPLLGAQTSSNKDSNILQKVQFVTETSDS